MNTETAQTVSPTEEQLAKEMLQRMARNVAFGEESQAEMRLSSFVIAVGRKLEKFRRAQFELASMELPND